MAKPRKTTTATTSTKRAGKPRTKALASQAAAEDVDRPTIAPQVIAALDAANAKAVSAEEDDLENDLDMTTTKKKGMAGAYQTISRRYPRGLTVSNADAGGCGTVADAIDLVHARANGKRS